MSAGDSTRALHERIRRLLFIVPYVTAHPGQSVDHVAKAAGISRDELVTELEFLTLIGRPPFQPDDFIDVYVEDDKVHAVLHQKLSAPPRLTAAEGVALAAAAALFKPRTGDPLDVAIGKIVKTLPTPERERFEAAARQLDVGVEAPSSVTVLTQAIVQRRRVTMSYVSAGRSEPEERHVHPYEVLSHEGHWYLSAYCELRKEERLFRLDRIQHVALAEGTFERPVNRPSRTQLAPESNVPVRVRFSPQVKHLIRERFKAAAVERDGHVEMTVPGDSLAWLTSWVLSFGGDATVISPPAAVEAVRLAARRMIERHHS